MRRSGTACARWSMVVGVLVAAAVGYAGEPPAPEVTEKRPGDSAAELLHASRQAIAKLKTITYVAVVEDSGEGAAPGYSAEVTLRRTDAGVWAIHTKGSMVVKPGGGKGGADGKDVVSPADGSAREFEIGYDGFTARSRRDVDKVLAELSTGKLDELRAFFIAEHAGASVPWEILDAKPMPLPEGSVVKSEGTASVGPASSPVACRVVSVTARGDGATDRVTRYTLGVDDHLPRKIERLSVAKADGAKGSPSKGAGAPPKIISAESLLLTELKRDEPVMGSLFVMPVPDGYMVKAAGPKKPAKNGADADQARDQPAGPPRSDPELLAVGTQAPAWKLTNTDGKVRTLADFRGKVVVMDFWGTWCPWCVKAMPQIQKVHEKFKGKPVVVLGMNSEGDPNADPVKFMRDKGFTYEVILKSEQIAKDYQVKGWPTLYVIGADGAVVFAESGFSPKLEGTLTAVIEEALKDTGL